MNTMVAAARDNDLPTVQALLARGVPVNAKDSFGYTALFWAVAKVRLECVRVLLAAGADPNAACHGCGIVTRAAMDSSAPVLEALLAHGGSVNALPGDAPSGGAMSVGARSSPLLALA